MVRRGPYTHPAIRELLIVPSLRTSPYTHTQDSFHHLFASCVPKALPSKGPSRCCVLMAQCSGTQHVEEMDTEGLPGLLAF
jgi:hypothetical protein